MVSVWGLTDRGIVRRENQDSCAYEIIEDGDLAWGVVCDGMGGAKASDIASKMAVETFCAHLEQLRDLEGPPPRGGPAAGRRRGRQSGGLSQGGDRRDCVGMGTTLVGMILRGTTLWVVNVGDSRAYHITKQAIRADYPGPLCGGGSGGQRGPDPRAGQKPPPEKFGSPGPWHRPPGESRSLSGNCGGGRLSPALL